MNKYRVVYIISDIHLGQGRDTTTHQWHVLEDFRVDDAFCAFIEHIGTSTEPVELVIAGDFIEYLQIMPELGLRAEKDHYGITEHESLQRTFVVLGQSNVGTGHPAVFASLREFISKGHYITIIAGNHDVDLLWSRVWLLLYYNICPPGSVQHFKRVQFSYTIGTAPHGRIYIEHGHERDRANSFGDDMREPFLCDDNGTQRLKRCWGTLFVDKVYNDIERQCWFIDNVKPIAKVIQKGLGGDFLFTATALALIGKFFFTKGLPLIFDVDAAGQSTQQPSVERVIHTIEDRDVQNHVIQRLKDDPTFREQFNAEMQRFGQEEQQTMQHMQQNASINPWQQQLQTTPHMVSFAIDANNAAAIQAEAIANAAGYMEVAQDIMERDPKIATVVMGHTHTAIDNAPIPLSDGRQGAFFNSGTWTPRLVERRTPYSWEELAMVEHYVSSLDYIRCIPDADGAYRAELCSWQQERT